MIRRVQAIITVQEGRGGLTQYPVQRVENYTTDESMDNDADTFTITLGDSKRQLDPALERDNEVRVNLFINDKKNKLVPIFTGIADSVTRDEQYEMTITGRDTPTSLAMDSDAIPARWKNVKPQLFLEAQAAALGISNTQIAKQMSPIRTLFTDGSETIWAFWYRIVREKGMYMWTNHQRGGTLYVDKLGYSLSPSYYIGDPPRGQARNQWMAIEAITQSSQKQGRWRRVYIHGVTAKKGKQPGSAIIGQAVDVQIRNWLKQPIEVLTSTVDKTLDALHTTAGAEVFEALVGAVEWQLTIQDTGQLIQQNRMCMVNLPKYMPVGSYFIVGVTRQGGPDGMTQVVRLRERGFALSKRVPDPPTIAKTQTAPLEDFKPPASIAAGLQTAGVKWASSFLLAAQYGKTVGGWDLSVFLGVLLSICQDESGFSNIRENASGYPNNIEWHAKPKTNDDDQPPPLYGASPEHPGRVTQGPEKLPALLDTWHSDFANDPGNPLNPYRTRTASNGNAGVGPMQLTDSSAKDAADQMGWNGTAKVGEYDGGRWNPDSNIQIAARVLVAKGKEKPPLSPINPDDIWIAVQRYNGGSGTTYSDKIKKLYGTTKTGYLGIATSAIASAKAIPPGSKDNSSYAIPGHGTIAIPDNTPDAALKAMAWAKQHLGEPYHSGGTGAIDKDTGYPEYDCSSFVCAALQQAAPYLDAIIDGPDGKSHGATTFTLYADSRYKKVAKDQLLPADMVFFVGSDGTATSPGHMGMYLGDNLFIQDPHTGDVIKVTSLGEDYYVQTWVGARRAVDWSNAIYDQPPAPGTPPSTSSPSLKKVMIQAGHTIPDTETDEPYGHSGETGASGEQAFTTSVRDHCIALFSSDPRFLAQGGTAWDASAGATASTNDDIDYDGDLFVSVHYSVGTPGSGFFFGYTRGVTDGRTKDLSDGSAKLADDIAARFSAFDGAPSRNADNEGFGEPTGDPTGASGWGYYAWGSKLRAAPNNVNHVPNAQAAVILECGLDSDATWLDSNQAHIATALYRGICDFFNLTPHST